MTGGLGGMAHLPQLYLSGGHPIGTLSEGFTASRYIESPPARVMA